MPPTPEAIAPLSDALVTEDLCTGYLGIPVVRGLNLRVGAGEVVALLGPNGAGKTTTLETIAGLVRPISGSIRHGGRDIAGQPAHVLARAGSGTRARGPRPVSRAHRPRAPATGAGPGAGQRGTSCWRCSRSCAKCLHRKAGLLSGGEQQMLAIGRALVSRPGLLLVDEMSLGLAPVIVERLLPILRRAADDMGASVLFVEQHVALALEISDRAYVLTHGRIALEGAAQSASAGAACRQLSRRGAVAERPAPSQHPTDSHHRGRH